MSSRSFRQKGIHKERTANLEAEENIYFPEVKKKDGVIFGVLL